MQNGTNVINGDVSCSNKASDTMDAIFSFDNLYNSYLKCIKGVKWKQTTQEFMFNACFRIARIHKEIHSGQYKMDKMHFFKVCERGKIRNISALSIKDRIVHKCLCDNFLTPLLAKSLIYDSGATIKNKGILFTKNRTITHLQRYYRKHGNSGYVLRVDFHNYFESIKHEVLFKMLRQKIKDDDLYKFTISLIPTDIKGLGLGSQISQICAMYYLNDIDHYCKEKLHLKYYSRYMDDIYVISNDIMDLVKTINYIKAKNKDLCLTLNNSKTTISKLSKGFVYCKVRYILTDSGKVLKLITNKSFRSMRHKVKKIKDIDDILPSWVSYVSWFNAYKKFKSFRGKYLC